MLKLTWYIHIYTLDLVILTLKDWINTEYHWFKFSYRGRIENYNPKYLQIYNQKIMPGGVGDGVGVKVPGGPPGAMAVRPGPGGMPSAAVSIPGSGRQGRKLFGYRLFKSNRMKVIT